MSFLSLAAVMNQAYMPADLFMPAAATISNCTSRVCSVSPNNVYVARPDIRSSRVQRILDYFEEHGQLPEMSRTNGIFVNKVLDQYQVGQGGSHRTIAARVLRLRRIRVEVSEPDYSEAIASYLAIRCRGIWYMSEREAFFSLGSINLSRPLPDHPQMLQRLHQLGFTLISFS